MDGGNGLRGESSGFCELRFARPPLNRIRSKGPGVR